MKPLFALLACLGFAAASVGCSQDTTTPAPDNTPDLGNPGTMDDPAGDPGSTTGGPDLGNEP